MLQGHFTKVHTKRYIEWKVKRSHFGKYISKKCCFYHFLKEIKEGSTVTAGGRAFQTRTAGALNERPPNQARRVDVIQEGALEKPDGAFYKVRFFTKVAVKVVI